MCFGLHKIIGYFDEQNEIKFVLTGRYLGEILVKNRRAEFSERLFYVFYAAGF